MHINVEFKARCNNPDEIRRILQEEGADYKGRDHQVDIYFNVRNGRLKLRKGNIENNLIAYDREDLSGVKQSNVHLVRVERGSDLEQALKITLGVKVIVDKQRDIYFIENVKFHLDEVEGLGRFIEVEAIDSEGIIGKERLQEQCEYYKNLLGVMEEDMISKSYSDLLIENKLKL